MRGSGEGDQGMTATHMLGTIGAPKAGTTQSAKMSMVVLRAALTVKPRLMRAEESHPPPMEPNGGAAVDDDEREAGVGDLGVEAFVEEVGDPEEMEPPDAVGEEFSDGECDGLAAEEEA